MPVVQTTKELGLAIRARRKDLGWDQASLAKQAGVTRQWIIDIEKGKPRAELALTLRALRVLGLALTLEAKSQDLNSPSAAGNRKGEAEPPTLDIDAIVEANRIFGDPTATWLPKTAADYLKELDSLRSLPDLERAALTRASDRLLEDAESLSRLGDLPAPEMATAAAKHLKAMDSLRQLDSLPESATATAARRLIGEAASLNHLAESLAPGLPMTAADQLAELENIRETGRSGTKDHLTIDPSLMPKSRRQRKR